MRQDDLLARDGADWCGYALLALELVVNDRIATLQTPGMVPLAQATNAIRWPANTLLSSASGGRIDLTYLGVGSSLLIFGVAAGLFVRKDLLWTE